MSWLLSAWMVASLASAGPEAGDGKPGAESPEAVVAELRAYDTWGEFNELMSCYAPGYREDLQSMLVAGALITYTMKNVNPKTQKPDPKAKNKMNAVLKGHGMHLDMEMDDMKAALAKADIKQLIGDIADLLFGAKVGADTAIGEPYKGVLEGLTTDGDHAQAQLDGEETHFVKVDGAWYIGPTPMN